MFEQKIFFDHLKEKFQKSIEAYKGELAAFRTGFAGAVLASVLACTIALAEMTSAILFSGGDSPRRRYQVTADQLNGFEREVFTEPGRVF